MAGINERVKNLMASENVSQTELAKRMGCTRQNINSSINGENMSVTMLEKLLDAIGYRVIFQKK